MSSTSRVWQDLRAIFAFNEAHKPLSSLSYKKATVSKRLSKQAESGRRAVAEQVWQAVSLLSLHLHTTSISSSIMVMTASD